jgi:hypothetical protein
MWVVTDSFCISVIALPKNVPRHEYSAFLTSVLAGSKGKAIPLQAWTGREGCRRLRLPDFKTIVT